MINRKFYEDSLKRVDKSTKGIIRRISGNNILNCSGKEKLGFYTCFKPNMMGKDGCREKSYKHNNLLFVAKIAFDMDNPFSDADLISIIKKKYYSGDVTGSTKNLIERMVNNNTNDDTLKTDIARIIGICKVKSFDTYKLYEDILNWSYTRRRWIDELVGINNV